MLLKGHNYSVRQTINIKLLIALFLYNLVLGIITSLIYWSMLNINLSSLLYGLVRKSEYKIKNIGGRGIQISHNLSISTNLQKSQSNLIRQGNEGKGKTEWQYARIWCGNIMIPIIIIVSYLFIYVNP